MSAVFMQSFTMMQNSKTQLCLLTIQGTVICISADANHKLR